ncbi:hypothetical protein F0562_015942 [Nyssa sinensis]|uniref:Retrovirus-related Pol polyprotein from transposon TNT 1-94-like beta-barrel domain-containing protein n=1 Tax=Nyssa sinensis TaxID=561372 RepID=A0A5J4ZLG7_9ASTE|nr:hypothetical protein F0562_015942 [Nyssa sinensis]
MVSEHSIANAFVDPMTAITDSSSSSSTFHLPAQVISIKLDGTNFLAWSAQLLPLFRSYDLMRIVDGSEPSPPQFSSAEHKAQGIHNSAYVVWQYKDQTVLGWIISSLSPTVVSTIYGLETSQLAWQALGARFAAPSTSRISLIKRKLQSLLQGSMSCQNFLDEVKSLVNELSVVGKSIDDSDLILSVLNVKLFNQRQDPMFSTRINLVLNQVLAPTTRSLVSQGRRKAQGRHPPIDLAAMVAKANTTYLNQHQWYTDSGANIHVTSDIANLATSQPYEHDDFVGVGNRTGLTISRTGTASIKTPSSTLTLNDVAYCPQASAHLLFINKFCKAREQSIFTDSANCLHFSVSPPSLISHDDTSPVPFLHSSTPVLTSGRPESSLDFPSSTSPSPSLSPTSQDSAPSDNQNRAPSLPIPSSRMLTRSQTGHSKPRSFPDFQLHYSTRHLLRALHAVLGQLVLNGATSVDAGVLVAERYNRRTSNVDTVLASCEASNFPSHPSIDLDYQHDGTGGLVLAEGDAVVRRHRHVRSGDEWRPNVDVFVALVSRWYGGVVCDLLVAVASVDVEFVVVDADLVVRVPRVDGDLDVGGEIIGGGDVEGEDGGVLKDEAWFPGLEDGPDDEDEEEEDEVDNQKSSATLPDTLPPPVLPVFGAPFFRHVLQRWVV